MFGLFGKKKKREEPKFTENQIRQSASVPTSRFMPIRSITRQDQPPSYDNGFAQSMALGYALDNGLVGGLIGGNIAGGMIGDVMNTPDTHQSQDSNCHDSGSSWSSDSSSSFDSGCSDSGSSSGGD